MRRGWINEHDEEHYERHDEERRAKQALRLLLQPIMAEFLEEVGQSLAPATERACRIPLALFLRHLRDTLGREPTLDDVSVETVRDPL